MRQCLLPVFLLTSLLAAGLPAAPPNFVVILADDLGYGDLSTYGGWIDVPNLDRLAAEGLRFTDFHSNGAVCSPTRAALLTGRYQQRAGIPGVVVADTKRAVHEDGLQSSETTFAGLLKSNGYATGIFGKWHVGYYPRYNPVRHGFDIFRGYVSGNVDFFSHVDQAGTYDWWHDDKTATEPGYVTHLINKHAVRFIEENKGRPFCLYVPHEAPHSPYQGPGDKAFRKVGDAPVRLVQDKPTIRQKYREMVVEVDNGVGEILSTLERLGLDENTLVFFFSDNGATPNGSNGRYRGTKATVWEGGHRVPAIARWTGSIRPGAETDQLAMGFDLMPTMLELAGIAAPVDRPLDGFSLAPVLLREEKVPRNPFYWQHGNGLAMRDGRWKYIEGQKGLTGTAGLYDLNSDPAEKINLATKHPERTARMKASTARWLSEVRASAPPQPSMQ